MSLRGLNLGGSKLPGMYSRTPFYRSPYSGSKWKAPRSYGGYTSSNVDYWNPLPEIPNIKGCQTPYAWLKTTLLPEAEEHLRKSLLGAYSWLTDPWMLDDLSIALKRGSQFWEVWQSLLINEKMESVDLFFYKAEFTCSLRYKEKVYSEHQVEFSWENGEFDDLSSIDRRTVLKFLFPSRLSIPEDGGFHLEEELR